MFRQVDFGYSMRAYLVLICLFLVTLSSAAMQPNFSGIWKMDAEKSDWGPQSAPVSVEYVIRHVGSKISFNYTQDGKTSRVDITPDNEERITSTTEENATWTRAYWSGDTLVLEARERKRFGPAANLGPSWVSRWTLSPDGQQFIIERTIRNAGEEAAQHLVFSRQPIPPKGQQ
jgi:hypothetical protein